MGSPPEPPARARLSLDEIVATAMLLIERNGERDFSMRMLADELGSSTMATYRHVPNRRELLFLVADAALSEVEVPGDGDWEQRVDGAVRSNREVLRRHPWITGFLIEGRRQVPAARRFNDAMIELLSGAGFDPDDALFAMGLLWVFINGSHFASQVGPRPGSPHGHTSQQHFDWGLSATLAGLRSMRDRA